MSSEHLKNIKKVLSIIGWAFVAGGILIIAYKFGPDMIDQKRTAVKSYQLFWGWLGFALINAGLVIQIFTRVRKKIFFLENYKLPALLLPFGLLLLTFTLIENGKFVFIFYPLLFASLTFILVGIIASFFYEPVAVGNKPILFWKNRKMVILFFSISGVLLIGNKSIIQHLNIEVQQFIYNLNTPKLAIWESNRLERNYYENLIRTGWFNSSFMDQNMRPYFCNDLIQATDAARETGNFINIELVPDRKVVFLGKRFSTNRWGMRDKDYSKDKPTGTFRIAILGPSHTMGLGVADGETFEALLEDKMNADFQSENYKKIEILNFACSDYTAVHYPILLRKKVLVFNPDVLFIIGHSDQRWSLEHLAACVKKNIEIPYPHIRQLIEAAGLTPEMTPQKIERLLQPYMKEITLEVYKEVVDQCRESGIQPYWIFLPLVGNAYIHEDDPLQNQNVHLALAREAGFNVLDLSDVYAGHEPEELKVAMWDPHPNARGHQLIADRLYDFIKKSNNYFKHQSLSAQNNFVPGDKNAQ